MGDQGNVFEDRHPNHPPVKEQQRHEFLQEGALLDPFSIRRKGSLLSSHSVSIRKVLGAVLETP